MGPHILPARGVPGVPVQLPARRTRVGLGALAVLCLVAFDLCAPGRTAAFCRESTSSAPGGDCSASSDSALLFWDRGCMTYVFNANVFSRVPLGEAFVRRAFATSYQTWADVECSMTPSIPFLVAQSPGTTTTSAAEFLYDQPNESIVVVRNASEWASLADHDALALALTLIWHDKKTGEILDVDMELNGGAGTFTDCSTNCSRWSSNIDLQNTVTHEAGHLLGLGHSSVRGATMQPSTTKSPETEKRSLEPDDIEGYCALGLPAGPCAGSSCTCPDAPVYASHRSIRTCSCQLPGQRDPVAQGTRFAGTRSWALLACAWLWRGWRRARRAGARTPRR